mmetsp:Transcript_56394/g.104339  ORF Transcript_56394/g.104339 Transcript_56394/m.104339 type:complete len:587 (+) Transcript_56394:167-1927(+)
MPAAAGDRGTAWASEASAPKLMLSAREPDVMTEPFQSFNSESCPASPSAAAGGDNSAEVKKMQDEPSMTASRTSGRGSAYNANMASSPSRTSRFLTQGMSTPFSNDPALSSNMEQASQCERTRSYATTYVKGSQSIRKLRANTRHTLASFAGVVLRRRHSDSDVDSTESRFVDGFWFQLGVNSAIILNGVQLGLEVQVRNQADSVKTAYEVAEHVFTAVFFLEMVVKLAELRPKLYFADTWNWVDCLVVCVSVLDNWILALAGSTALTNATVISNLRLIRLARILKVLRLKRELMMIIEGIVASLKSMVWLALVLLVVLYIVSIFCVKVIAGDDDLTSAEQDFDFDEYFGDVLSAMLTLFNLALLTEWDVISRPILNHSPWVLAILALYIGCTAFGLLNAIVGVIVTRTEEASKEMEAQEMAAYRTKQMQMVEEVSDLIYTIDRDGDGEVSEAELRHATVNKELMSCLKTIDLPYGFDMRDLHKMLDRDGDGKVTKEEFREGMHRLVYSNDFHRQCLLQLYAAEASSRLHSMRERFARVSQSMTSAQEEHDQMMHELAESVRLLEEDIGGVGKQIQAKIATKTTQQ